MGMTGVIFLMFYILPALPGNKFHYKSALIRERSGGYIYYVETVFCIDFLHIIVRYRLLGVRNTQPCILISMYKVILSTM